MSVLTPEMRKQVLDTAAADALAIALAAQRVAAESNYNNANDPAYIAGIMTTITQMYLKGLNPRG